MISLTPKATIELTSLLANRTQSATSGLRLGVSRGGCAGWQYEMKVAEPEAGDTIIEAGGARVIIAADSVEKLSGCAIDFSDDLTDAGFKIINPQAVRSCGCGTSFETSNDPPGQALEDGEACGTP